MNETSYKAVVEQIVESLRAGWPGGKQSLSASAPYLRDIFCDLIRCGLMIRVGDDAHWPEPVDPDAAYNAAVEAFVKAAHAKSAWGTRSDCEAAWNSICDARAARDAAKAKAKGGDA